MANIVASAEAAVAIPTIVAANALGHLKANTVFAQLVARDWDDEVAESGDTVNVTIRGALVANDKAEDTAVTLQTPTATTAPVVLNKHKEVSFIIEDPARLFSRPDLLNGYVEDGVKVIAEAIDADIAALYSGFSQTIDATSGSGSMLESDWREGRRLLNAAKAPAMDRFAVIHEDAEYELFGIEKFVNQDYSHLQNGTPALNNARIGRFMGFDVYMNQGVTIATTQAKNWLAHRNSAALVTRPLPAVPAGLGVTQSSMSEDGIGLRVTMSYDTNHLGYKVTIDVLYGVAEIRDNHAVIMSTSEI